MNVTQDHYNEVKGYATKVSTLGFTFLDAAPTSPIGQMAIASGDFFVNEYGMLEITPKAKDV